MQHVMETLTCHLVRAGAKEAANYSLTCKYYWEDDCTYLD